MHLMKKTGMRLGTTPTAKGNTMVYVSETATVEYGTPEFEAAKAELVEKINAFAAALNEAIAVADKYGLEFSIEPAYGMGGTYSGKGNSDKEECYDAYAWQIDSWGWYASSQSC